MNQPANETQLATCKRLAHELVVACIRDGTRSPLAPRIDAPASDSTRVAAQLNAAIEELAKPHRQNSSSTAWLRRQCAQRVFAFKRAIAAFAHDQVSASAVDEAERSLMDATTALADHITQAAAPAPAEPSDALALMAARKDAAYLERNQVVAALAKCFPSGVARTAIEGWSEDWHGCVYIDLPTGQASWHFHDSQAHLFAGLPPYTGTWDGHDTPEKYRRLAALEARPSAGPDANELKRLAHAYALALLARFGLTGNPEVDPASAFRTLGEAIDAALTSGAPEPDADLREELGAVFHIGSAARTDSTIIINAQNASRRSACLSAVEAAFFTTTVKSDEDEDEEYDECPLSWNAEPAQYVEQFRAALTTITAAHPAAPAPAEPWRPMETAPKGGDCVLLLIEGGEHPLQDESPSVSIGSFGVEGGAEEDPTWHFAGWSWHQDCYCRGTGTPIGWTPLPAAQAAAPTGWCLVPDQPTPEMAKAGNYCWCPEFVRDYKAMLRAVPGVSQAGEESGNA